jgi:hypothetical protein
MISAKRLTEHAEISYPPRRTRTIHDKIHVVSSSTHITVTPERPLGKTPRPTTPAYTSLPNSPLPYHGAYTPSLATWHDTLPVVSSILLLRLLHDRSLLSDNEWDLARVDDANPKLLSRTFSNEETCIGPKS